MAEVSTNANLDINTSQPKPLRGLRLRGIHPVPTINTVRKGEGPDGEDLYMTVNEADYDREIHGEKVDKLPSRKKVAKKVSKKTASAAE